MFFVIFSVLLHSNLMNIASWEIWVRRYFIGNGELATKYSEDMWIEGYMNTS